MKQYVIDELRPEDYEKINQYFCENCRKSAIEGVFWLKIPDEFLSETQQAHKDCQPYYFTLELEETSLSCGFLVRSGSNMRCHCIGYADFQQRNWLIDAIDSIMEQNGIII